MTTSKTNPAFIDLQPYKERRVPAAKSYRDDSTYEQVDDLIAAVEALRERGADWDGDRRALVNRVATLTSRAEASEARAVELAEALEDCAELVNLWASKAGCGTEDAAPKSDAEDFGSVSVLRRARIVLAATPAAALERARGFEQLARNAVSDLRRYARDDGPERRMVSVQAYEKALANLDALKPEDGA